MSAYGDTSRDRLWRLIASQPLAVLSTASEGVPYASLVAIAADGPGTVYFATTRATRKWANLRGEPHVALLLDDRSGDTADFHDATAATGVGVARECTDEQTVAGRALITSRHPHLAGFLASPTTAVVRVDVERWYVVTRFQAVDVIECGDVR